MRHFFYVEIILLIILVLLIGFYKRAKRLKRDKALSEFYTVYANKDYDTALWLINQYVESSPNDAFAYMLKGSVLKDLERVNAAIRSLKEALNKKAKLYEAHKLLIDIYMKEQQFEDAVSHFNEGVKIQRNNFVIRFNRGINYMHLDEYNLAIKDFHYVEKRVNGNKKYIYDELALAYKAIDNQEQYSKYALLSGSY